MSWLTDIARRAEKDTFMGYIAADNGDGSYKVTINQRSNGADDVDPAELAEVHPVNAGSKFVVGQAVMVGNLGVKKRRYVIIDNGGKTTSGRVLNPTWPSNQGFDCRRSWGTPSPASLPQSILKAVAPVVDTKWKPSAVGAWWYDGKTNTLGCQDKWVDVSTGAARALPMGFVAYADIVVNDGRAYNMSRCFEIATGAILWDTPVDPDGLQWGGLCLSEDGRTLFAQASQGTYISGAWWDHHWVRAVNTADGTVKWRKRVTSARVKGGGTVGGGLVHDGYRLYVRYGGLNEETAVTDMDLSSLDYVGAYGITIYAHQYDAGFLSTAYLVCMAPSTGAILWTRTVSESISPSHEAGPLMMVGGSVAMTLTEVLLPDGFTDHAFMPAGHYTTTTSHITVYYAETRLYTLDGLTYSTQLLMFDKSGVPRAQSIEVEEYTLFGTESGWILAVPIEYEGNRLGSLMTGSRPSLVAHSRPRPSPTVKPGAPEPAVDPSGVGLIIAGMAAGTAYDAGYPSYSLTTLSQALPDYWTNPASEERGPPGTPVWKVTMVTNWQQTYRMWVINDGSVGSEEEFIPSERGVPPYVRYLSHGGTVFGGDRDGMTVLVQNGNPGGPTSTIAPFTEKAMGAFRAIDGLPRFYNLVCVLGTAYCWDGSHIRRFR